MANRTDTQADTVHGGNPQYLVDRIVRTKIYNDHYWKESCFALTTETLIDRASEMDYVAGTYGGRRRPAKFLCLILKMLQIQPDEEVIMEYIKQPDLKYLRALGATYLRLTSRAKTIFETLEPLYADYRKLRYRNLQGKLSIIHMDEWIDWLFNDETICDITMPQLPKREVMEFSEMLEPRQSVLEDDLEDLEELEALINPKKSPSRSPSPAAAAAPAEAPAAPTEADDAEEKPRRSATPPRSSRESPVRRRSRGRSQSAKSGRQRSRSARRQPARHRSRSRQGSDASRGSEGRRDRKKDKARKEKEKEKEKARKEKDKEREVENDEERLEKLERKQKKDKKEKKEVEETEGKNKKEKKEKKEDKIEEEEKKEKKEKDRGEKKKKGLFKGDVQAGAKEKDRGGDGKSKKEKDGLSVDAWNDVRKQLGLKPLNG